MNPRDEALLATHQATRGLAIEQRQWALDVTERLFSKFWEKPMPILPEYEAQLRTISECMQEAA